MASDREMIDTILGITDDLASMSNVLDDSPIDNVDIVRLRKLYPHLNSSLAILCGIVECFKKNKPGDKTFTQRKFHWNGELLALVEAQKQ